MSVLLAVDGGNSKTHVTLARVDGEVLAFARGPVSSPHAVGEDGCLAVIDALLDECCEQAGIERDGGPVADVGEVLLAGADLPAEELRLQAGVAARRWASRVRVANDTFAVLRAGTERGWGVAVVCGAGINCVGVGPDGRQVRFPALGTITGDWGGGYDVGLAALFTAVRSADGRGPRTALEAAVPGHFGLATPAEVGEAIHEERLDGQRLTELAPVVLALAEHDAVAARIADRLAAEVVGMARVALERLGPADEAPEVVLGGGVLRSEHEGLVTAVRRGIGAKAPHAIVRVSADPPIVGAALLGLDALGAGHEARVRLRRELGAAAREEQMSEGGDPPEVRRGAAATAAPSAARRRGAPPRR